MFQQLKSSALKTAYNFARKKGIHCPDCEEPLDLPRAMPLEEKNETISCDQCSWFGTPSVLLYESTGKAFSDNDRKRRGGLIAHPVAKPANSKIKETTDGQNASFLLPARKKINAIVFFSVFWLAFTTVHCFFMLSGSGFSSALFFLIPFYLIFFAVGIGMAYVALRSVFMEQLLVINDQEITHLKKFFGRTSKSTLPREQVSRVVQESSHSVIDRPIYEIRIHPKEPHHKRLKIGLHLDENEKDWLQYSLQQLLTPPTPTSSKNPYVTASSIGSAAGFQPSALTEKNLTLTPKTDGTFSLLIKKSSSKFLLPIGAALLIGALFLGLGEAYGNYLETQQGDNTIDQALIPGVISLILFIVALTCLIIGFKNLGLSHLYEFGKNNLIVKTLRNNSVQEQKQHAKNSFHKVTSGNGGEVNGSPRYKLKLHGSKKSYTLHNFLPLHLLEPLEDSIDYWLNS